MKIKVCGITSVAALNELEEIGVDYAGLIFYPGSKRYVGEALDAAAVSSTSIKKIGVFVNAPAAHIKAIGAAYKLFAVQLHGAESPAICAEIRKFLPVIKAISVNEETDLEKETAPYKNVVDYFLFDTKIEGLKGGTGQKFSWALLQNYTGITPFFLSGGISADDAPEISAIKHAQAFAVDINSRFELSPGVKNMTAVRHFVNSLAAVPNSIN